MDRKTGKLKDRLYFLSKCLKREEMGTRLYRKIQCSIIQEPAFIIRCASGSKYYPHCSRCLQDFSVTATKFLTTVCKRRDRVLRSRGYVGRSSSNRSSSSKLQESSSYTSRPQQIYVFVSCTALWCRKQEEFLWVGV